MGDEGERERAPAGRGTGWRPAVGSAAWLGYLLLVRPGPFDPAWPGALLLLAVLVLVPAGLRLAGSIGSESTGPGGHADRSAADRTGRHGVARPERLLRIAGAVHLPAALLLTVAYGLGQGRISAGLALPWLGFAGLVALAGVLRIARRGARGYREDPGGLVADAGLAYLAVGAAWAVADRLGWRPLDFSPVIVLLTAVHFHYAGFVLPIVAGLAIRRSGVAAGGSHRPGRVARLAGLLTVLGVPAVAVGITGSQVGLGTWLGTGIEAAAAWTMAAGGLLVAWLHLRLATGPAAGLAADGGAPTAARALWAVAAVALAAGMVLAALYGARFLVPGVRWLDIGWMQALHGAANSLGFALPALAGWWLVEVRPSGETGAGARRASATLAP